MPRRYNMPKRRLRNALKSNRVYASRTLDTAQSPAFSKPLAERFRNTRTAGGFVPKPQAIRDSSSKNCRSVAYGMHYRAIECMPPERTRQSASETLEKQQISSPSHARQQIEKLLAYGMNLKVYCLCPQNARHSTVSSNSKALGSAARKH